MEVLVQLLTIGLAESCLQLFRIRQHRVEHTATLSEFVTLFDKLLGVGRAKEMIENGLRIILGGQWDALSIP